MENLSDIFSLVDTDQNRAKKGQLDLWLLSGHFYCFKPTEKKKGTKSLNSHIICYYILLCWPPLCRCYSSVGNQHVGKQRLSIGRNCDRLGTVEHEFMHALGFWHEQSRADRDDYVNIMWDRIEPGNTDLQHSELQLNTKTKWLSPTFLSLCPSTNWIHFYTAQ